MGAPVLTITSAEKAVTLTLTESEVTMRLSDHILDEVHREIEDDKDVAAPGWAGNIARFVTDSVEKMLRTSIAYPLADIASVNYVNGAIVFTYHKQRMMTFEDVMIGENGKRAPALASFSPEDAQAFVAKAQALLGR